MGLPWGSNAADQADNDQRAEPFGQRDMGFDPFHRSTAHCRFNAGKGQPLFAPRLPGANGRHRQSMRRNHLRQTFCVY